jgi:hypothetical protein
LDATAPKDQPGPFPDVDHHPDVIIIGRHDGERTARKST